MLQQEHLGILAPIGGAATHRLTLEEVGYRAAVSTPRPTGGANSPGAVPLAEMEKRAIADALQRTKGNKSRAAALLGVTRMQLYTRLKRFGLGV